MKMAEATILVVDDEPALLEIFSLWLKRQGATVLAASNGAEALKVLTTQKVDALVSDMRMPVMDGVALVRGIHELCLSVPSIIFVSGFSDATPRLLYSLGVEAMLPKPLSRQLLLDAVETSLRKRSNSWLLPPETLPENSLHLAFPSLPQAIVAEQFSLGRGGCCVRSPQPLPEGPIIFHLSFEEEALSLDGQGIVRWSDPLTHSSGIEFVYLEPASRAWVLERIQAPDILSFIPFC